MHDGPGIAEVAALMGDPSRANMLAALLDGRARSATELALVAGVTLATASGHLARLVEADLLAVERQGRHRYFRLAGPAVAHAIEGLMTLASAGSRPKRLPGPRDPALRAARTCYDHLAGRLGVAVTEAMLARDWLAARGGEFALTGTGEAGLASLGVDLAGARRQRRAFARGCLDWSERRPHLAGALGAAVAERCFALGWIARPPTGRSVEVTPAGRDGFREAFGVEAP